MRAKKYELINFKERFEMEKLLSHNWTDTEIANRLGRNKSSIQRAVTKNGGRAKYRAIRALRITKLCN